LVADKKICNKKISFGGFLFGGIAPNNKNRIEAGVLMGFFKLKNPAYVPPLKTLS